MSKFFDVEEVEFDLLGAKNPLRGLLEGYVSSLAEKSMHDKKTF